jgi:O-antigen/teichoic acid export membrane protein
VLVVRIAAVVVAIALGACVLLWLATGERKWLRYAWNTFRVALALVAAMLILLFAERLLVL